MNKYRLAITTIILAGTMMACNEAELLKEVPKSQYSPENSYITPAHFEMAITYNYDRVRAMFYNNETKDSFRIQSGSDYIADARNTSSYSIGDYNLINPETSHASWWWQRFYEVITYSNMIIDRLPASTYTDEVAKTRMEAEARFFRGFAYRCLANLYGGVPLVLKESTQPKRDYVRATREETWQQAADDLKFAAENLPDKGEVSVGRVNSQTAGHFLAEVYISLEQYDEAVAVATAVIDHPSTGLMKTRFGSRKTEAGANAYWDLFQMNNQNLPENTEALWVVQNDIDDGRPQEAVGNYKAERIFTPQYYNVRGTDGKTVFLGPNTNMNGRGAGYLRVTKHFNTDEVWLDDAGDLRNKEPNMVREWICDNPASVHYGEKLSELIGIDEPDGALPTPADDALMKSDNLPFSFYYAVMSKVSQRGDHPAHVYDPNPELAALGVLSASGSKTYHDLYQARLAETYLLRAEAHLGNGDNALAAADVNEVRARVNAAPITVDDIDDILDERIRELAYEEPRMMTLCRLGLVYDRVSRLNNFTEGQTVAEKNNLWPIPYSEIEKNTEAVLEQNPGYVN